MSKKRMSKESKISKIDFSKKKRNFVNRPVLCRVPSDRTRITIEANSTTNSNKFLVPTVLDNKRKTSNKFNNSNKLNNSKIQEITQPSNPFRKLVSRHYGSFKVEMLGNFKKKFERLPNSFKEKGRLGTTRRKYFNGVDFSLIVYSSGLIEIKPAGRSSNSLHAGEELSTLMFEQARAALIFLKAKNIVVSFNPVLNRLPKYAVPDKVARLVKKEVQGEFRGIDCSVRQGHVDNHGLPALNRHNRLSEDQIFRLGKELAVSRGVSEKDSGFKEVLAKESLDAPEILGSIEKKLGFIVDSHVLMAQNESSHVRFVKEAAELVRLLRPKRVRVFRESFKNSATLRAVN